MSGRGASARDQDPGAALRFPCPCCGRLVHDEPPGSYEICPVCFWEDDAVQLRRPTLAGGANRPSLVEAQRTYARRGAMEERFTRHVRAPEDDEPVDAGWVPYDPAVHDAPGRAEETDPEALYWWRWPRGRAPGH